MPSSRSAPRPADTPPHTTPTRGNYRAPGRDHPGTRTTANSRGQRMRRIFRATLTVGAVTTVAVLGLAGAAQAHVTVNPNSATQGGYARIAFRVPTESDTASTTKLEVQLPANQPIASVST